VGATNKYQIDQNIAALDTVLPEECRRDIIAVSSLRFGCLGPLVCRMQPPMGRGAFFDRNDQISQTVGAGGGELRKYFCFGAHKQNLLDVCKQWGERLTSLLAIGTNSEAPREDGNGGGRGSLLCDHGPDVLCPRGKAPPNSLDITKTHPS